MTWLSVHTTYGQVNCNVQTTYGQRSEDQLADRLQHAKRGGGRNAHRAQGEIDGLTHGSADFAKLIAGHPVSCELLDDYRTVQCDLRRGQMPVSSANGSIRNQVDSRVPFTFKSWGENVQAEVFGVDGDVQVQVKSTRRMSTTLIDWEKNADNVKRFTDWLTKTV